MARNDNPQTPDEGEQASTEVALINDTALLAQFGEMAVAIPSDIGGGTEDILRKVLQAATWEQLDEPWRTSDVEDILGKTLRITKVVRRPSTFSEGLGVFLVVHLTDPKDGKEYVKTTGSVSVVAQLARAYFLGVTNMLVKWCRAERQSERGYYPQHLEVVDASTPVKSSAE
jgi:hypothetical protein